MTESIGWYVHHHGRGHLTRLLSIAPHVDADIRCFSSLPRPDMLPFHCTWTMVDRDDEVAGDGGDPRDADPTAGGLLHWAPLGHRGHRGRMSAIVASLADDPVDAFVVDVSVEVTLLVRLLGFRVVLIAQPGARDDSAHHLAFQAATTIVAPWPRSLLEPAHLAAFGNKTVYTGGISRYEARLATPPPTSPRGDDIVVLGGAGGSAVSGGDIASAAQATGRRWHDLGATPDATWSADPWGELTTAGAVVSWAGQNAIADLAAAETPAIVIPQERPFAEQRETARALEQAGLAIVIPEWPERSAWSSLIERATNLRPDWDRWEVRGAAARAARAICETAGGCR
ncbi:glycosyltransferase [Microbacterium pygmaeum]|uniref:Glycosyltransferase family 28 C-terminal domain-containing protein n=1 Tax=Microbacterium pygmaeum TaxID=370764 RepID=A0A1G8DH87_9MICO|nr:glycosyltransferase [Microbacterium pygmaeum]SDH57022.1 Glycosyltransferase family 28 C-terminal domain-containing protein [Microbacterium pygmaeum]